MNRFITRSILRSLLLPVLAFGPLMAGNPAAAETAIYRWPVLAVVDGDTLKVTIPGLPVELNPIGVRLLGVNTPETGGKAQCQSERELGQKAKALAQRLVTAAQKAGRPIEFRGIKWDKYGGRIDARVLVAGQDLAAVLIANGLGRPYDGGKRGSWCG